MGLTDAARYLAVSAWTIREMVWRGDLVTVKLPRVRRLLFDQADLDQLVERGK